MSQNIDERMLAFVREAIAACPRQRVRVVGGLDNATCHEFREMDADKALHALGRSLSRLEAEGVITIPTGRGSRNEAHSSRLPIQVRKPPLAKPAPRPDVSWHPRLSGYAHLIRDPRSLVLARQVNDFLIARNGSDTIRDIDFRERALEVTGDEKAFDRCSDGVVLSVGGIPRITFADLRCVRNEADLVASPLVDGPGGLGILVVENQATYRTLAAWNRVARRHDAVVFGQGNAAPSLAKQMVTLASDLRSPVVSYFGDIDVAGLVIPHRLGAALAGHGRVLLPDLGLYGWLMANGKRRPATPELVSASEWETLARSWMGQGSVQDAVIAIVQRGLRIAQEAVNPENVEMAVGAQV